MPDPTDSELREACRRENSGKPWLWNGFARDLAFDMIARALPAKLDRIAELETQLRVAREEIEGLESRAAFGDQCWQDSCENAFVEQSIADRKVRLIQDERDIWMRQAKEWEAELEKHSTDRANHQKVIQKLRGELRRIAFWVPTVCYEHDDRRYVDIEDVYALKRIAADARDERDISPQKETAPQK